MARGEEGLQVLRNHVVEHGLAGIPGCVGGHGWCHTSSHGQQGEDGSTRRCPQLYCSFVQYTSKKVDEECGGNMRDTPLCRRRHSALSAYPLSARWQWKNSVCFSYTFGTHLDRTLCCPPGAKV